MILHHRAFGRATCSVLHVFSEGPVLIYSQLSFVVRKLNARRSVNRKTALVLAIPQEYTAAQVGV